MFRKRPFVTALVTLAVLAILVPVSYAVVDTLYLSIDHTQSEQQIAADVTAQLESAGVTDPQVEVEKDDDSVTVSVQVDDPSELPENIEVAAGVAHSSMAYRQLAIETEDDVDMDAEQMTQLATAIGGVMATLTPHEGTSDEELAEAVREVCADHGYDDVQVTVEQNRIRVVID